MVTTRVQLAAAILGQMVIFVAIVASEVFTQAEEEEFVRQGLKQHNDLRSLHKVGALEWDKDAESMAKWYVDVSAERGSFEWMYQSIDDHVASVTLSMNTIQLNYCQTQLCCNASFAAEFFCEERHNYDYNTGKKLANTTDERSQILHFTQIVWKATTHIGFARKVNRGSCFMIFIFRPTGNIGLPENYIKNIHKPRGYNSSPASRPSGRSFVLTRVGLCILFALWL